MLFYRFARTILFLLFFALSSAWANAGLFSGGDEPQFLDPAEVFTLEPAQREGEQIFIQGHIAQTYYVYRHSLELTDQHGQKVKLALPPGTDKHDEFFGDTKIFKGDDVRIGFTSSESGPFTLHWQGCAEAGICYPPQTITLNVLVKDGAILTANSADTVSPDSQIGASQEILMGDDQKAARQLASLGPIWGTLLFFGFGLLLAFTPCSLPMIPIISSMVVGSQARPRRALVLSLSYVVAMAGTYALAGVAAGIAGANLQAALQSPWLLGSFAALFIILAFSLFGLFELQLPAVIMNRVDSAGSGRAGGSVIGAVVLGFLSALLVGPCMTAPLAGALLFIGQSGSAIYGGLALFALGVGMGLPLLVIAVFGARALPKPGAWMDRVRITFGYVMVGMAVLMLVRFVPDTVGLALRGTWVLLMAIGLVAWAQMEVAVRVRLAWSLRSVAVVVGLWGAFMLIGAASGGRSPLQPLSHLQSISATPQVKDMKYVSAKTIEDVDSRIADAVAHGQWSLIDFYADWCVSCHVIERNVFGNPEVISRLNNVQVIRPDVTKNDETDKRLLKQWGVMGPPTLILVGSDGHERRQLRIVGEIDAAQFLERLDAAGEL